MSTKARLPSWLVPTTFAEALVVAGFTAYGFTYLACVLFYGPLGVEPADVGLGYAEVLAQAAVYLGIAAAFSAGVILTGKYRSSLVIGGGFLALSLVIAILSGIVGSVRVRDGRQPGGAVDLVNLLPWSDAEIATVRWTGAGTAPPLPSCVVRLGESSGTEILYDSKADATLRLPQASVSVRIEPRRKEC